MGWKNKVLWTI